MCEGRVSGTVEYAWRNRRPRAASALNAGVTMPLAPGPIASARVVSRVTSRMEGRAAGAGGCRPGRSEQETANSNASTKPAVVCVPERIVQIMGRWGQTGVGAGSDHGLTPLRYSRGRFVRDISRGDSMRRFRFPIVAL